MAQFTITNFLGTRTVGPVSVPLGVTHALITLSAENMIDPAMTGSVQLDLSLDSGATWASTSRGPATDPFPVTMTFQGGTLDKHGVPVLVYDLNASFPHPEISTRQVQATLTVAGVPLTSTCTLTAS